MQLAANRARRCGRSSWGAGPVAPHFLSEGKQQVGLRSGQQRASRASSHPGAPKGQRPPTSLVKEGTSYALSQASRPATQADPANPVLLVPLSARRRWVRGPHTLAMAPWRPGRTHAPDSASGGRGAANPAVLLGARGQPPSRGPGLSRGGRVAAGCAASRPARLRGDEESAFEAGLPCSRQRRWGVPRPRAWGALCCRRMDWSLSARREQ